jgi:Ca2+-transporting ATPase
MAMIFATLILIEFAKAYNFRSDIHSVLRRTFANRWLNIAVLWETGLLLAVVYVPFLQGPFGTSSLRLEDWAIIVVLAVTVAPVLELAKWMERRSWLGEL